MDVTTLRRYYVGLSVTSAIFIIFILVGSRKSSLQRAKFDRLGPLEEPSHKDVNSFKNAEHVGSDLGGPESSKIKSSRTTKFAKKVADAVRRAKLEKNMSTSKTSQKRKKDTRPKPKDAKKHSENNNSSQKKMVSGRKPGNQKAKLHPKSSYYTKIKNSSRKKKEKSDRVKKKSKRVALQKKKKKVTRVKSEKKLSKKKQQRKPVAFKKPKHSRNKSNDVQKTKSSKNENKKGRRDTQRKGTKKQLQKDKDSSNKRKNSGSKGQEGKAKEGKKSTKSSQSKSKAGEKAKDKSAKALTKKEQELRRLEILKKHPIYSEKIINPHPFHFVNESSNCAEHAPNGQVFLLVLVACRPGEDKDRRWIRDTWGSVRSYRNRTILVRFLVGRARNKRAWQMVAEETALYGDLVQENFMDTYHNMTYKVLMGLKWAARMCPNASYVMNLDSDMFVNVFRLVDRLEKAPRRDFAEGRVKMGTRPMRSRGWKWYTPFEMYAERSYPPHLNGPAYVMSGDLPARLFNASAHVRYLPWDDVFIGLVMKKLGTKVRGGRRYEVPLRSRNPAVVLPTLLNSIATTIGHRLPANFVLRDIWPKFLGHHHNYIYDPPSETRKRLNISTLAKPEETEKNDE